MLRSSIELSGWECVVVDAPSGEEALLELGRGPIDLLVADIKLPGISGVELVKAVRQLNPEARAILITGEPTDEIRKQAAELGVIALLPKPIGTSLFLEAVAMALRERGEGSAKSTLSERAIEAIRVRLETLRGKLDAAGTALIDEYGRQVVRVGEAEGLDLDAAIPSLLAAASAGLKVSQLIGGLLPNHWHAFQGGEHSLFLFNIGAYYNLVIITRTQAGRERLEGILKRGEETADELLDLLSSFGAIQTPRPEEAAADAEARQSHVGEWTVVEPNHHDETNEELKEEAKKIKKKDADSFWDEAAAPPAPPKNAEGDILTYEEARKQGLLKEEAKKDS